MCERAVRLSLLLTYLALALSGCADILGFEEVPPAADTCRSSADCPPGHECKLSHCISRRCTEPGKSRCSGLIVEQCSASGEWKADPEPCDAICRDGGCYPANSCEGPDVVCSENQSCCKAFALAIDSSGYEMPYDYGQSHELDYVTRTVRAFSMDRFEVTVSRFRAFMAAYEPNARSPDAGSGKHPAFPDSGWREEWNASNGPLPHTRTALKGELMRRGQLFDSDVPGELPVRGVSWYAAFAFCIFDQARLPTEAEWAYAALGGNEKRTYPWRNDWNERIDHEHAVYADDAGVASKPEPVGSRPDGIGLFEQMDLAGNVAEWVADKYEDKLPRTCKSPSATSLDEHECLELGEGNRVLRGGSFKDKSDELRNVARSAHDPAFGLPQIGFRCVRDLSAEP